MTGGGERRYWNLKLEILAAPSLAVQFFRSPLLGSRKNFRPPPLLLQFFCSPEKRSLDCIKYTYRYCLQWFILWQTWDTVVIQFSKAFLGWTECNNYWDYICYICKPCDIAELHRSLNCWVENHPICMMMSCVGFEVYEFSEPPS